MVSYTAETGEHLDDFLERCGYTHVDKLKNANGRRMLQANCISLKKLTPDYDDLAEEFKHDKKKSDGKKPGHVAFQHTALVRYFKHQTAERAKERAAAHKKHGASPLAAKGGVKK